MASHQLGRVLAAVLLAYVLLLIGLGVGLDGASVERLFAETGPFEQLSIVFWVLLALVVLVGPQPGWWRRIGGATAAVLLAMREAGWHKAFTTDSLFKTNYYEMPGVPIVEKLLAGAVALAALALLVWLAVSGFRALFLRQGWRRPWGRTLFTGAVILVVTKVVDRAPAILEERFDIVLPPLMGHLTSALEEGVEMALPLIFLAALVQYGLERRQRRTAAATGQDAASP